MKLNEIKHGARFLTESPRYSHGMFWIDSNGEDIELDYRDGAHATYIVNYVLRESGEEWDAEEDRFARTHHLSSRFAKKYAKYKIPDGTSPMNWAISYALNLGWVRAEFEDDNDLNIEAQTRKLAQRAAQILGGEAVNFMYLQIRDENKNVSLRGLDLTKFVRGGKLPGES